MLLFLVIIVIIYIISMALQYSGTRAQERNKTKSLIIFKSRDHTGVIISSRAPPTIIMLRWKSNFEEISFEIFTKKQDFHKILMWLRVHSKLWVQQQRKHACPGSVVFWE